MRGRITATLTTGLAFAASVLVGIIGNPVVGTSPAPSTLVIPIDAHASDANDAGVGCDVTYHSLPVPRILRFGADGPCNAPATVLPGPGVEGSSAGAASVTPGFTNYALRDAESSGEPTVGVTPSGNIFFLDYMRLWRSSNGGLNWDLISMVPIAAGSLDPMLWVDTLTGRIFFDQLYAGCSQMWWSDAEGNPLTWRYNPAACGTPGNDHQKIATGPFHAPLAGGTPAYPNAVYYCYNGLVYGACSLSPDGGLTWNPAVNVPCGGILGHPHVALDGTLYVPSDHCGSYNGVGISRNNGLTWTGGSTQGTGKLAGAGFEPDVTTTPDGTIYMSGSVDGGFGKVLPYAFVSTDGGVSWVARSLVGTTGVQSTVFPVVTSGIDGRAAVAFLGSTTAGNPGTIAASATWQLYVSFTYDAGATWETIQASPLANPVQRGTICLAGLSCGDDRNLLDFMDVTHDNEGYVIVGYADGCVSTKCVGATGVPADSRSEKGTIAKQTAGTPLL